MVRDDIGVPVDDLTDLWHFSTIKMERGTSYPFARNIQGSIKFLF